MFVAKYSSILPNEDKKENPSIDLKSPLFYRILFYSISNIRLALSSWILVLSYSILKEQNRTKGKLFSC